MKKPTLWILTALTLSLCITPSLGAVSHTASNLNADAVNTYRDSSYNALVQGSQLADAGAFKQALPYFKTSVELNPTSVLAQYNLAYSLMMTAEESTSPTEQQMLRQEAEWAFLRVRDLNPDLSITYYKLGKLALLREDYQAACSYYESGTLHHPENFALWFNLAASYEKTNQLDDAEKAYLKAISLNPRFVYAHNNLALLYEQAEAFDKAEVIYKEALRQVPEYNYARLNLGSMLQSQGRLDEALDTYLDAIAVEPDNAWAYLYLGNTYYRQGNYHGALNAYNVAITLNPQYPTTYYLASLALHKLNRTDEALAKGLQYINLAPNGVFSQEANELVLILQRQKSRSASHP